jgi:uncharacterized membrane protein
MAPLAPAQAHWLVNAGPGPARLLDFHVRGTMAAAWLEDGGLHSGDSGCHAEAKGARRKDSMDSLYLWLKFVHVAAVTVWIGGVVALMVLNARFARLGDVAAQAAMGRQSEDFGRTVIGPAMAVTLLAGLWMAGQFGIPFTSLWIVWGLVGFISFVLIGIVATGRAAGELGALASTAGPDDPRVASLRGRLQALGALNLLLLASVIWAMVFKPTL